MPNMLGEGYASIKSLDLAVHECFSKNRSDVTVNEMGTWQVIELRFTGQFGNDRSGR